MTEGFVDFLQWLTALAFVVLAVLAFVKWRQDRNPSSGWMAVTFATIGAVALQGRVIPEEWETVALTKIVIIVAVFFPYSLYRFGATFSREEPRFLKIGAAALTAAVMLWGLLLPDLPEGDEPRSPVVNAFFFALLIQWVGLSLLVSIRFWREGRNEPEIARRRTRLLSIAAGLLGLAIILAVEVPGDDPLIDAVVQLLALSSALSFYMGYLPPELIRTFWRRRALEKWRRAVTSLLQSTTEEEVTESLLPRMSEIVGAEAIALVDDHGQLIDSAGTTIEMLGEVPELVAETAPRRTDRCVMRFPFGSLVLWTSPYTPFFGAEDLELLQSLGTLAHFALERTQALSLRVELAEAQIRRRQALDINDNIVQGLAVAKYAFDLGETEKGRKAIDDTLTAARRIVSDLLEQLGPEEGMRPGMLVRQRPAGEPDSVLQRQASDPLE